MGSDLKTVLNLQFLKVVSLMNLFSAAEVPLGLSFSFFIAFNGLNV